MSEDMGPAIESLARVIADQSWGDRLFTALVEAGFVAESLNVVVVVRGALATSPEDVANACTQTPMDFPMTAKMLAAALKQVELAERIVGDEKGGNGRAE